MSQVVICRFSFAWMDLVSYKDHGGADLANDERRVWEEETLELVFFGMMKYSSATRQPKGSFSKNNIPERYLTVPASAYWSGHKPQLIGWVNNRGCDMENG